MIIGKYAVNPLQVFYGRRDCINNCPMFRIDIHVMTDDDIVEVLTQYTIDASAADKMLKLIDECIAIRKEAQLDGTLHGDNYDYEE